MKGAFSLGSSERVSPYADGLSVGFYDSYGEAVDAVARFYPFVNGRFRAWLGDVSVGDAYGVEHSDTVGRVRKVLGL